jgi:putative endonuclease
VNKRLIVVEDSYIYIMASKNRGTLYTGVTSNLIKRIYEHRNGLIEGFTKKYNVHMLVYYEVFSEINYALKREKQLKNWHRDWKVNLIENVNPYWQDLYLSIVA